MHSGVGGLCAGCLAATAFGLEDEPDDVVMGGDSTEPGDGGFARSGPDRLGDYELLEELGRGGMGVVYRARQRSLERDVALKVIPGGPLADPDALRRFRMEARAAARLNHPHVVKVHEVGETDSHAFFSMELIAGPTLSQRVKRGGTLAPKQAAAFVAKIASAIQHAHDHGLLHRDLKPSNILIDPDDEPRVADFGLVKSTGSMIDGELTLTNQSVGTPAWFAPEQTGEGEAVPQTDVYGVGALLYYALTGRAPFPGRDMATLLDQVRNLPPVGPRVLDPSIPRDLETICLKAMEKTPARRYGSAGEMAEDLGRWLAGDPILARPVTVFTRMARWVARHRALSAALGALVLAMTAGAVGVTVQWRRAERLAEAESEQRQRAEAELWQSLVAVAQRERASGQSGGSARAMEAVRRAAVIKPGVELRDEAVAALVMADFGALEPNAWALPQPERILTDPQFSPRMDRAVMVAGDGGVKVVDARTGAELVALAGGPLPVRAGNPPGLACGEPQFSPGGRWIVVLLPGDAAGRGSACNLLLWSAADGAAHVVPADGGVMEWAWSADERVLAILRSDHLERMAVAGGSGGGDELRSMGRAALMPGWRGPALSADGGRLAIGYDRVLRILDAATGRELHACQHQQTLERPSWSADGLMLAVGTHDNRITVWDTETGMKWAECNGHDNRPSHFEFLSAGVLLSGSWDRTARLWNPWTGRPLITMPVPASAVAVPGSGGALLHYTSSGVPGVAAVQRYRPQRVVRVARLPQRPDDDLPGAQGLAFTADGALVCSASARGLSLWEASTLKFLGTQPVAGNAVSVQAMDARTLLFSAAGGGVMRTSLTWRPGDAAVGFSTPEPAIVSSAEGMMAQAWAVLSGGKPPSPPDRVNYLASAGRRIAVSRVSDESPSGKHVELWEDGRRIRRWNTSAQWPVPALSPDGKWLATGGTGFPLLFPAEAGLPVLLSSVMLEKDAFDTWHCAFAPDGSCVVFQGEHHIDFWEVPSRRLRHRIDRPAGVLGKLVAFSPDGTLVAALGRQWDLWLIDPASGRRLVTLTPPEPFMTGALVFSPDSRRLAAALVNGTVQVWDLPELRGLLAAEGLDWEGRK
jgi:WD40 repeat protein